MDETKSKVYILTDERGCILRCEGGYTMDNIDDLSAWTLIDEGTGDRYNLCQSHYFEPPLYEEHGIPVWEYVNGTVRLRAEEDVEADIAAIPVIPSQSEIIAQLTAENKDMKMALEAMEVYPDE